MFSSKKDTPNFETSAASISQHYTLDFQDVKKAYADKPDSLTTHFNALADADHRRTKDIAWAVGLALTGFGLLIVALPVYFAVKQHQKINEIGRTVRDEISRSKALPPATPPPAP